MVDSDSPFSTEKSYQGRRFHPANETELREVIEKAFDYRGDVTLCLKSGQETTGFIFDRHEQTPKPFLRMLVETLPDPKVVAYEEIREIVFSGEDTAFGKSWEEWVKKWEKPSMKKTEE